MISSGSGGVVEVVKAVAIVPINKEQIHRPVNTHTTANTRPASVRAVLSPYLLKKTPLFSNEFKRRWTANDLELNSVLWTSKKKCRDNITKLTYPTVVMVIYAHQKPLAAPLKNFDGNSSSLEPHS